LETSVKKIREKNNKINIIQDGAILINGNNIVNNSHLNGSFLKTFNGTTEINNTHCIFSFFTYYTTQKCYIICNQETTARTRKKKEHF